MPDDRLIHRKFGRGQRASKLSHFEFRVWVQYLVSSDDYGVMLYSIAPLQADNTVFAKEKKPALLLRALDKLVEVGLVLPFEHQGLRYICSPEWDEFQKVRYPRDSHQPCPPAEILERCKGKTREFFARHPRNSAAIVPQDSGNKSEIDRSLPCAGAQETANGLRQTANGERPKANAVAPFRRPRSMGALGTSPAQHTGHGRCNDRGVCLPQILYTEILGRFGNDVTRFDAFYNGVLDTMPDDYVPTGSVFRFWHDMLERAHPEMSAPKQSPREAAMNAEW